MNYRFEVGGEQFGTVLFKTLKDAQIYLEYLLDLADDRYKIAAKTSRPGANNIREVRNRIARQIKIVPVPEMRVQNQKAIESVEPTIKTRRYSSKWQRYNDIGEAG